MSRPQLLPRALVSPKVLIADDDPYIRELLARWLAADGCEVEMADSTESAWACLDQAFYGLVLADINMPGDNGLHLLELIKGRFGEQVAVLMVTALDDRELAVEALRAGAYGYVVKPFDENEILINVANALERRRLMLQDLDITRRLEETVRARTAAIRRREEEMAWRLLRAIDSHDIDTGSHVRRIGLLAQELARAAGWEAPAVADIKLAAAMHDIGKLGIPDEILIKPGSLSLEERATMQEHTVIGGEILCGSDIPLLQMATEIALCHHEQWDGTGYPRGLAGERIPESARIVAIVDVYDALLSRRPYRDGWPVDDVLDHMLAQRGKHFDPRLLDLFFSIRAHLDRLLMQRGALRARR